MLKARLLDLGQVTAVRSQTVYHAVAECAAAADPPTLCVLWPDRPYVSIGYHQQADKEVDLDFCRENGIPVIRRMVGGGAVLLDSDQLFFHLIIPNERVVDAGLPLRLAERYPRLVAPAIAAYAALGVSAYFRPVNDIHVAGRKIGGTGTASIGDSFVFVGSMMVDFDHALMARVLRFSVEEMRGRVRASMEEYVTSLCRETGGKLRMECVRRALLDGFRGTFGLDLEAGVLTDAERELAEELDGEFVRDEWLHRISWAESRARRLAINCAVRYCEAEHRAGGGLLRLSVRVVEDRIDDLLLSGDFSLFPGEATECIRSSLLGAPLHLAELPERAERAWRGARFEMPGVSVEDFSQLTRKLVEAAGT